MKAIDFIVQNWAAILEILVIITALVVVCIKFLKLTPEQQKARIKLVLLSIVTEMEKQYGPKTGAIKRSQAYSLFVSKFPILSVVLSQETFDRLLDEALEQLNSQLQANSYVEDYVTEKK